MERKYIDVNVFVYWLSGSGELMEKAKNWIKKIEESGRGEYITSTLTVYEVLVIIAGLTGRNLKEIEFVEEIMTLFSELNKLTFVPMTKEIIENSLAWMKKFSLDFEDAIHYTTAKKYGASKIVTNDRDFQKTDIKPIF